MPVWRFKSQPETAEAAPTLTPSVDIEAGSGATTSGTATTASNATVAESRTAHVTDVPLGSSPFSDRTPTPDVQNLEDVIRSGDRYRMASALAAMGVSIDDDLLSKILLPPGQPTDGT